MTKKEISKCLILAAGKGTRMGIIGKSLPKVLWPIFEKSLIELQISFAIKLGCKNIFINLFCEAKMVEEFIYNNESIQRRIQNSNSTLTIIKEPELLDIGGAIHNLKNYCDFCDELLILNSDQFLFFDQEFLTNSLNELESYQTILFASQIISGRGYNSLKVSESNLLEKIELDGTYKSGQKLFTYSGTSLINLNELDYNPGPSKFFETVCNFKSKKNKVVKLENYEYWDFGTTSRYFHSMMKFIDELEINSQMKKFLLEEKSFLKERFDVKLKNYGECDESIHSINLGQKTINGEDIIVINETSLPTTKPGLYFQDQFIAK